MKNTLLLFFICFLVVIVIQCTSTIVVIKAKGNGEVDSYFNKDVEVQMDSVNMLNWQPQRPAIEIMNKGIDTLELDLEDHHHHQEKE